MVCRISLKLNMRGKPRSWRLTNPTWTDCRNGPERRLKTVPDSLHPGSEVANLAVLGYDVEAVYEGRGVIEAASIGVALQEGDMAMRCNLVTLTGEIILNHSADISLPKRPTY